MTMTTAQHDANASAPPPRMLAALLRLHPYVQGSYVRLILGIGAAVAGAVVALTIPAVLSWIVDGPIGTNDVNQIIPAVALGFGLGVL